MSSLKKRAASHKNSQGSLKKGGKDSRREFKLVDNDPTTSKLLGLKDVKFLNTESKDVLNQTIDANEVQKKTGLMAEAYLKKQQNVASNVQKIIDRGKVAQMEIFKKSIADKEAEDKARELNKRNQSPGMANLMNSLEQESSFENNKIADGFVRSKRNLAMRAKDNIDSGLSEIEDERSKLHEKLNQALIRLDGLNHSKKEMSEKLVEQIKFVRDLQKATGGAGVDDLNSILSSRTRDEYKRQKELKAQLEHQLSRAERERQELLDRIKLLTGEKEIVVVNVNGQRKTYRVTTVNIERLINEIRDFKGECHHHENAIEQTRQVLIQIDDELYSQERQLQALRHERDHLFDKVTECSVKQEEAVVCLEGEKRRMMNLHKMHIKLLATRLFEETLQKIVKKTVKPYFEFARTVIINDMAKMKAVYNFRKMIWVQDRRKSTKNLQKWYQLALKPTRILKANCTLPVFFNRKEQLAFFYQKWRSEFRKKSKQFAQNDRGLSRISAVLAKVWARKQQKAFIQWRRFMFAGNDAIKGLMRVFNFQQKLKMQNAFRKWQTRMVDQDFSIRMQALCIQVGLKQLAHKVLLAWKQQIIYQRMINRHRMLRAFKNLKVLVDRRKIVGQLSSKNFHKSILKFRQQACFDQLRYWKEEKKLIKVMAVLTGEIAPKIANWKNQIGTFKIEFQLRMKKRAIRILVIQPFGKQLSQWIQQWKKASIVKRYQSKYNLKALLIRLYHSKQKVGFDRWKLCYAFQVNAAQVSKIQNLQISSAQLEGAIKEEINQIELKNHEIKSLASKRLRKLVIMAFERNLHHFLMKWNEGCQDQRAKQDAAILIRNKIRQRILRIALTEYKRGVRNSIQDSYNVRRIEEVQARLATRNKKRIVRAWMNFTANHHNATRFLANLVNHIDAHNKIRTFKTWKKFTICERESALFVKERGVVEMISDHQDKIGALCDKLNEKEIVNKRLNQVLKTQGQLILQKWVERFHNGGKHFGFQTWKQQTIKMLHRDIFVQSVRRHLVLNTYRKAMDRWRQTMLKENQNKITDSITETEKYTEATVNTITFIRRMGQKNRKENDETLVKVNEEIRRETKKIQNTISALIRRQDHYHHMKRSRYILHQWYRFTSTRKKCVQSMVNGINKIFLQYSLNHIRRVQYQVVRTERKEKAVHKLLMVSTRFDTRICMHRWRQGILRQENQHRSQVNQEKKQNQAEQNEWILRVKNHRRLEGACRLKHECVHFLFESWRKVTFDWRVRRDQKEKLQQRIEFYQKKRMLLKWQTRQHNCIRLRRHVRLMKEKRHGIYLSAFWQAFKYQFKVRKDLCTSVVRALEGKMFEQKLMAFQSILCRAQINNHLTLNSKLQACSVLVERLTKLWHRQLSISVLSISEACTKNYKFLTITKSLISSQKSRQLRTYMARWRRNIELDDIQEELNTGSGPVNVECWNLRLKMFNLIDMCGYDRASEKDIQKLLAAEKKRYSYLMEKSICRILVYRDNDLYLMPYCLDRIRSYVAARKLWSLTLGGINRRAEHLANKSEMFTALKTWKAHCDQKVFALGKIPITELIKRSCMNANKLHKLADEVEDENNNIQEYTDQRDMLFKGYMSGQKLAVSLGINNHKRAQQKAIMNLSDHGNLRLQSRIGEALHMNLAKISELKDIIADQEVRNELLAESNDSFRIGALDAVSFARQIEDLQRDRDRLQVELHERSGTIRKLLEDNQYLSYRIQDARKNTKEQLDKQTMIAHRQHYEREQMRQAERENLSSVQNGQSTGKGPFSPMRVRSPRRNN